MDIDDFDDIRPAIISAVIVLNITLNVIVVAVIIRYPILREDRTTLFMFSLTLSDLANGCTAMPISAAVCSRATPNVRRMVQFLPKFHVICSVWFTITSMHSLCWVTVCKMVAITKPLRYHQLLTRTRCYIIISGIWIFGAGTGVLLYPGASSWDYVSCMYTESNRETLPLIFAAPILFVLIFGLLMPLAVIVYSTGKIFRVIIRTHRQIAAQSCSIAGHLSVGNIPSLTSKSIRSWKNIIIICLAYLILTIPVAVEVAAVIVRNDNYFHSMVKFAAVWTVFCKSFVNSLLYLILYRNIRSKALTMLK